MDAFEAEGMVSETMTPTVAEALLDLAEEEEIRVDAEDAAEEVTKEAAATRTGIVEEVTEIATGAGAVVVVNIAEETEEAATEVTAAVAVAVAVGVTTEDETTKTLPAAERGEAAAAVDALASAL